MCEGSSSVLPSGKPLVLAGHKPSSLQPVCIESDSLPQAGKEDTAQEQLQEKGGYSDAGSNVML